VNMRCSAWWSRLSYFPQKSFICYGFYGFSKLFKLYHGYQFHRNVRI